MTHQAIFNNWPRAKKSLKTILTASRTRIGSGSACSRTNRTDLRRASGRKGRRGGSWYRIRRLHHSRRRAGGSRGTGTADSVQNSASAAASVAAAVAIAVGVAVAVASVTAARTFAGTGRDQLIDRWDLGLQACRLARRIPALYSRNQSRTNIALCLSRERRGRDSLPS